MASHNHHWLRKWLRREPHFTVYQDGLPYLYRWFVLPRNHLLNIYLHKFVKSDIDEALHDHPWWFISWILKGQYHEHTPTRCVLDWRDCKACTKKTLRKRWSVAYRPAKWAHRVQLIRAYGVEVSGLPKRYVPGPEMPVWTLIVTGRNLRTWGFHCPKGWVPWDKFTSGEHGETRVGCGEYA